MTRAVRRGGPPQTPKVEQLVFGPYTFQIARRELKNGGEPIKLTDREQEILAIFAASSTRGFRADEVATMVADLEAAHQRKGNPLSKFRKAGQAVVAQNRFRIHAARRRKKRLTLEGSTPNPASRGLIAALYSCFSMAASPAAKHCLPCSSRHGPILDQACSVAFRRLSISTSLSLPRSSIIPRAFSRQSTALT